MKKMDSPILKGYQNYPNFVRPHEGPKGATPASKAGIKVEGENKWLTIIQNAAKRTNISISTDADSWASEALTRVLEEV